MTNRDEKVTTTKDQACLICCEDNASTGYSLARLNNDGEQCRHSVCRACLRFYLIQRENDRKTTATCPEPDCQALIDDAVVRDCLGREYTPKVWFSKDDNDNEKQAQEEEDPDESLKQWLRDNEAQQCWNCHAWITRSDGCEAMQCLCGWRFCWDCKAPIRASSKDDDNNKTDRRCTCDIPADHFYDNILGYDRAEAPRLATLEELQDMATLYARREDEECSDYGSDFDRSEVESYALDKDDPDWFGDLGDGSDSDDDDDGWDDDSVVSECGVLIGSILDYEEPADDGVFDGTILEWEEPVGAMVGALVPLWAEWADWTEENDAEAENDNQSESADEEDRTENDHLMAQEEVAAGDEPADSFAGSKAMEAVGSDDGSESESEADALTTTGDAGMPQSAGKKENDGEGDDVCSMTTASSSTGEDLEDRVAAIRLLEELAFWGPALGPPPLN